MSEKMVEAIIPRQQEVSDHWLKELDGVIKNKLRELVSELPEDHVIRASVGVSGPFASSILVFCVCRILADCLWNAPEEIQVRIISNLFDRESIIATIVELCAQREERYAAKPN